MVRRAWRAGLVMNFGYARTWIHANSSSVTPAQFEILAATDIRNKMAIGIYIENCSDVDIHNNRFHNVDRPVVANKVKNLRATGNKATYGTNEEKLYGVGGYAIKPIVASIWRSYFER